MKYEIWLGNEYIQFKRGLAHFEDGSTKELCAWHNSSCYGSGSVLVQEADFEIEDYPLRWYPHPGVIEFYVWDAKIREVTFHNESNRDYYVFGYVYMKPGDTAVIPLSKMPHRAHVRKFTPRGLVTLQNTSHTEPEYQALIGKRGLLLERLGCEKEIKTVWKFIADDSLQGEDPQPEGFETSPGIFQNTNAKPNCLILQTENSEYAVEFNANFA